MTITAIHLWLAGAHRPSIMGLVMVVLGALSFIPSAWSGDPQPELDVDSLVGCYEVTLGRWHPSLDLGRERKLISPPGGLHLLAKRVSKRGAPFPVQRMVEPVPDPEQSVYDQNYWQVLDDGRVRIKWTNGFSSLTMILSADAAALKGTAETFWDNGSRKQRADVALTKIGCR